MKKFVSLVVGIVVLVLGLMLSVVFFAVLVVAGLGIWAWLAWQTRALRRTMAQQPTADHSGGQVYEGEATVVESREQLVVIAPEPPRPEA